VKASKLTKVTRTGGFVGLIASFTAVPAAVAALVYKTAPAGQSSQQTFDESMRVAGLVAVPADVRQAWNAGNRIDAADKFLGISDAWNFIKLTVSDPNAAWEKTKQTGRDIAELYDLATAHPETLRAGLLALDKVGQDTALVADARAAALSGDKAGAQAAGLKAVNDALADKPLMDSVNNVSNILQIENYRNGKPFSPLPPQPANSNLVPNQAHNPPRAGLKNGGVVGMNVDAPMPSRPRKLALFGEDYVPQAA
jgi:hypothetical protein